MKITLVDMYGTQIEGTFFNQAADYFDEILEENERLQLCRQEMHSELGCKILVEKTTQCNLMLTESQAKFLIYNSHASLFSEIKLLNYLFLSYR